MKQVKTLMAIQAAFVIFALTANADIVYLVGGQVKSIKSELAYANLFNATVEITKVYKGYNELCGKTFIVVSAEEQIPGNLPVIVPTLKIGEVGIWALKMDSASSLFAISYEIDGKYWPVIEGRDKNYDKVVKELEAENSN